MDHFNRELQLLSIAKLAALEQAINRLDPQLFLEYEVCLKTLVKELLLDDRLTHPRIVQDLKARFEFD